MAQADERRQPRRTGTTTNKLMCECCQPPRPLFLRPDFGQLADGSARYALCLAQRPAVVHVNRGDGTYEKRDDLTLDDSGNVINGPDGPVATSTRAAQRQEGRTVGGANPFTTTGERVDLTRDNHYTS